MVNKQNLWFITLFSIILVLSIFYISMNESSIDSLIEDSNIPQDSTLVVNENTELVALRIQSDENMLNTMNELKDIILSETTTSQEKNDAYNNLLELSTNKGDEENIENIIKKEFNLDSFVKINANNVTIVIDSKEHNYDLANKIIRKVRENSKGDKYITVKFN